MITRTRMPAGAALVVLAVAAWCTLSVRVTGAKPPESKSDVPQFQYDASWPRPLPNNWVLGEVAGVGVDATDHIWITNRPLSHTDYGLAACCKPAPAVIEFDQAGAIVQTWGDPGEGYD